MPHRSKRLQAAILLIAIAAGLAVLSIFVQLIIGLRHLDLHGPFIDTLAR